MRQRNGKPLSQSELMALFSPPRPPGTPVRCHICGYKWIYRGKSRFLVSCPQCLRKTRLVKDSDLFSPKSLSPNLMEERVRKELGKILGEEGVAGYSVDAGKVTIYLESDDVMGRLGKRFLTAIGRLVAAGYKVELTVSGRLVAHASCTH